MKELTNQDHDMINALVRLLEPSDNQPTITLKEATAEAVAYINKNGRIFTSKKGKECVEVAFNGAKYNTTLEIATKYIAKSIQVNSAN